MNQESGKNPLKKLDMEQFIEDHSRDMMDGQEKMTAGQWLAVSLAWTLLGVLLANLEIKMIPWIGLLGWLCCTKPAQDGIPLTPDAAMQ